MSDAISVIESDPELSFSQKKEDIAFYEDQRHSRKCQRYKSKLPEAMGGDSSDKFVALVSSSSNQDDSNVLPSEYEIEKRKTTVSGYIMLMAPRNIM